MTAIKHLVKWLLYPPMLLFGLIVYWFTGKTPALAHQSMIWMFCLTGGRSNDFLSRALGRIERPYCFDNVKGVLGDMTDRALRDTVRERLNDRGYYVFENRLPDDMCTRLLHYATSHTCKMRPMDGMRPGKPRSVVYSRAAPEAVRYEFDTQDLLRNPDVQALLADMSFAAIAQDYLGARPVCDVLGLWWHTAFSDRPDAEAAQYFHFDMDRLKWLKFFIYLTDVEPTNGPHSFVAGSHATGAISRTLLRKGYARLSDEEVALEFEPRDIIEFVAARGTILAEDTRGLHKGKHVTQGDRLVLQFQFSNSLFGSFYPKARIGGDLDASLRESLRLYPALYSVYL
jgi:hypothetical protein